jgi:outer membrane protein TolC
VKAQLAQTQAQLAQAQTQLADARDRLRQIGVLAQGASK